jgi:hypothetical protein
MVTIKRRIQEQSNMDQTTGTPNMEKIVIMNAMKNPDTHVIKKKILLCEGVLGYVTADTTRLFSCTGISEMDPPYGVGEVFRW